jgi:hypothetical protein
MLSGTTTEVYIMYFSPVWLNSQQKLLRRGASPSSGLRTVCTETYELNEEKRYKELMTLK